MTSTIGIVKCIRDDNFHARNLIKYDVKYFIPSGFENWIDAGFFKIDIEKKEFEWTPSKGNEIIFPDINIDYRDFLHAATEKKEITYIRYKIKKCIEEIFDKKHSLTKIIPEIYSKEDD